MPVHGEYEPSAQAWVRDQVELYESSGGTQGTTLRDTGLPVVIVTNLGASSGKVRKTPVMRVEHDGRYAMVASKGGAPAHPTWYYNVRANPLVEIQDGPRRQDMVAREVSGDERGEWWKRAVAAYPPYAEYQEKTTREIPVFVLEPASRLSCPRRPDKTEMTGPRLDPGRNQGPVRQTGAMTGRTELTRRAQAHGVAVAYQNWRGRLVEVPDETLAAVLGALGDTAPPGGRPPQTPPSGGTHPPGPPLAVAPFPDRRAWGFAVQLYSVRSRASWGHGDLADLAALATWSGSALGADFILVNPLHAAEPQPPVSPSPYLPMSRRQISPLYLRIEDIPEYQGLTAAGRARVEALAVPLRAASTTAALIDRDAVWAAKRAALELIRAVPLTASRRAELDAFLARDRRAIGDWAAWCAIAEVHGPDWRSWPAALTDPQSAEVTELRRTLADRIGFHGWLQWLTAEQLAAARQAAGRAGMSIGVITDLAVGAHPGGADAWARQDVIVPGISVGAPPDEFNQRGQDWTLPPWHPGWLAAQAGRPLAELIAANTRHAGGLRVDHVMGLARLWWIPAGMSPELGTYVRYDHELMGGVLAAEVARAGALAIGEDLGTVEPWLRKFLAGRRVLGTSMLWFERRADGTPRRPGGWRRGCLATVGTHDMPPAAAFLTGEQVTIRAKLGLLTQPEAVERAAAHAETAQWLAVLARENLLPRQAQPSPEEFTVALYAYLTRTPAVLIGVSLAEAVGERRPQNMPGTVDEYPNWRIPLGGADGQPVLLEDLPAHAGVRAVAAAVSGGPRR